MWGFSFEQGLGAQFIAHFAMSGHSCHTRTTIQPAKILSTM
jgi:hypothetical protein